MDGEILAIHLLGFLMEVQEGRIGPKEAHSLFCCLGELEESNGDGNGSKG
jgi:hypothetical protein